MSKTSYGQQVASRQKIGIQHVFVVLALIVVFFLFFQTMVIPWGVAKFVVPLFEPSPEKMEKIGFVKFEGLVWASTSQEKAGNIAKQGTIQIKKDLIDKEYIFDFTAQRRTEKEHGYVKNPTEYYVKSEIMGEHPIYLEPWVGFWILALVLALFVTVFITMFMPTSLGLMAVLFDRQIDETKTKIRLQTGFDENIVDLLTMPDDKLRDKEFDEVDRAFRNVWDRTFTEDSKKEYSRTSLRFENEFHEGIDYVQFRNEILYNRLKEFYSDFLIKEIKDTKDGILWRQNHSMIGKGLRLYMAHHFTEKYSNNVTALAYGGAAFLIVAVGIRGLKFIPPQRPSFILLAIFLEFTMLSLLAVTMFYTEEEERMDKMLKKMEDANRSQLDTLKMQAKDIEQLSHVLVGQSADIIKNRVEKAISEYMTSDDNIKKVVAEEISEKILIGLRESFQSTAEKEAYKRK
jgi:hypothetical protein